MAAAMLAALSTGEAPTVNSSTAGAPTTPVSVKPAISKLSVAWAFRFRVMVPEALVESLMTVCQTSKNTKSVRFTSGGAPPMMGAASNGMMLKSSTLVLLYSTTMGQPFTMAVCFAR
jgi:hypothetical protein